jgi:8-oxo-dGTP diphosphatase
MSDKIIKVGCEGIIEDSGKILLGLRKNCYGAGSWGLPGGHMEFGEKATKTLQRELKEEIGVDFEISDFNLISLADDSSPGVDSHHVHISFSVKYDGQEIKLMEPEKCEEWKFFDKNNLPENIFSSHINIIKNYLNNKIYS